MPKRQYFFDYAATTPLDKRVLKAMSPYFSKKFGNPSSLYSLGRDSKNAIAQSNKIISAILNCKENEIFYTGSATEADNLAILGIVRANKDKGKKIIVSEIEHKGILAACEALEKEGFEIVRLPVEKNGLVKLSDLKKELTKETLLVSITSADSETGTMQPIKEISEIVRSFRNLKNSSLPYFHTDASQAAKYSDLDVEKLGVELMTLSAHKIYGPKGIGGLYVKRGINISPIIFGGGQQTSLRSGTENVPEIVGFAKSLELVSKERRSESVRIKKLRDDLEKNIFKTIPKVILNGHQNLRLPNFLNISILDIEGEAMLLYLDEMGIMVGTGSACNSQSLEPSYILSAMGRSYEYIHGSIRIALGRNNNSQDIKYLLKGLEIVVKKLRKISPLEIKMNQTGEMSNPKAFVGEQTPHFLKKIKRVN